MSAPGSDTPRPDWYPDPTGRHELRYFNGVAWTGDVATDGLRGIDPLPATNVVRAATTPPGTANGAAVASISCGIISVALGWLPVLFVVGAVLAVLAVVFGISGRRRARAGARGSRMALAGVLTGVAGLVVAAGGLLLTVTLLRAIDRYDNPPAHQVELTECGLEPERVEVAGVLRNDGDRRSEFTVSVDLVRAGSGISITTLRQRVGPIEAGATEEWAIRRPVAIGALADAAACDPPVVNGPLPFGVVPPR